MSDIQTTNTPTADPIGEQISALQTAAQARATYLETKKAAEAELRRAETECVTRIAIARARYESAVGTLRAMQAGEVAA
jgi:hypothetical protein